MAVEIYFFLCSTEGPKQPRYSFPFYKFFYPTISDRIYSGNILPEPVTQISTLCLFYDQNNEKDTSEIENLKD